jgi:hypothetical protein
MVTAKGTILVACLITFTPLFGLVQDPANRVIYAPQGKCQTGK